MSICQIALGSITYALKARQILKVHGISSEIIKQHDTGDARGCIYGLSLDCRQYAAALVLLDQRGVHHCGGST